MYCSVINLSQLRTKCGPLWLSNLKHVCLQPLNKLVMVGSSGDSISIESMMLISASTLVQNIVEKLDTSLELQLVFPDFSTDILRQLRKLLFEGISDHISKKQAEELRTLWKFLDVKTSVNLNNQETEVKIEIDTVANEEEIDPVANEEEIDPVANEVQIDHCPISPVISISFNNNVNEENANQSVDMFEDCDVQNIRSVTELPDNDLINREELVVTPIKQIIPQVELRKAPVERRRIRSSNKYTQEETEKRLDMKKPSVECMEIRSSHQYTQGETQGKKLLKTKRSISFGCKSQRKGSSKQSQVQCYCDKCAFE